MARKHPYHAFRFRVEFDSVQHGGFSRVKGLSRETKVESRREGGLNDFEHKLVTQTTYPNLVLERGLVDPFLWQWHEDVIDAADAKGVQRRTITVVLQNEAGDEAWRWLVADAYPVKWTGTDLDGANGQVLVESVELVHHGIKKG